MPSHQLGRHRASQRKTYVSAPGREIDGEGVRTGRTVACAASACGSQSLGCVSGASWGCALLDRAAVECRSTQPVPGELAGLHSRQWINAIAKLISECALDAWTRRNGETAAGRAKDRTRSR